MMDLEEAARRLNDRPVAAMRSPGDVLARGRRYRRRRAIRVVSSASCAAALLVAAAVVGTRGSTQHHSVSIVATTPTTVRRPSNKVIAERVTAESLDEIVVPENAQLWTTRPPAVVSKPAEYMGGQPSLMRQRIWMVPVSSHDAIVFLRAHTPRGSVPFSYSGGVGTSGQYGGLIVHFLQYWSPIHEPAIAELELNISVAVRDPHSAWVRADIQAIYRPERASDEYVTARDVVVKISQTSMVERDERTPPHPTVVVNDPTEVRLLRDAFNGLPTTPEGGINGINCPALTGSEPVYILSFQRSATSGPDLVATTQQWCIASTSVSVRGHSRPILEAGDLPDLAANLLHQHATRRH